METAGSLRSRRHKCLRLDALEERNFKKDPKFLWTAARRLRLADKSCVEDCHRNHYFVRSDEEKIERMHRMDQ